MVATRDVEYRGYKINAYAAGLDAPFRGKFVVTRADNVITPVMRGSVEDLPNYSAARMRALDAGKAAVDKLLSAS